MLLSLDEINNEELQFFETNLKIKYVLANKATYNLQKNLIF
jgi:hypothetical protein